MNDGLSVPLDSAKALKSAFALIVLVTLIVYVFVVVPSCAITSTVIAVLPTFSEIV
ncbi:hypothetical protein D3C85_1737530 [compost metagenome]